MSESKKFTPSPLEQQALRRLLAEAGSHSNLRDHHEARAKLAAEACTGTLDRANEAAEAVLFGADVAFASFSVDADGTVDYHEPEPEPEDETVDTALEYDADDWAAEATDASFEDLPAGAESD